MKKFLVMLMMLILTLAMTGCESSDVLGDQPNNGIISNSDYPNDDQNSIQSDTEATKTIKDLFNGEQRLWYMVDVEVLDPITYNTPINMVLVTENSKTIGCYYYATDMEEKTLVLADLDGLSDDQILDMVCRRYHSIRQEYIVTEGFVEPELLYNAIPLPDEIVYCGTFDKTGNHLATESVTFYDQGVGFSIIGNGPYVKVNHMHRFVGYDYANKFPLSVISRKATVKNKEYIDFSGLLTVNDDPALETVVLDSPEDIDQVR